MKHKTHGKGKEDGEAYGTGGPSSFLACEGLQPEPNKKGMVSLFMSQIKKVNPRFTLLSPLAFFKI